MSNLYLFCQSVEFGGFTAASLHTHVSAPTLSRAVALLEEGLGEKLIHRNAKMFQLTTAGEECYKRFAPLFRELDGQWQQLSNTQAVLKGDIRISCPEPFADIFLQQTAIEFMEKHPEVSIHIEFASNSDHFFDDQIDLAIVTTPAEAPQLIQKKLFNTELALAAAPAYLAKHGKPDNVLALTQHQLLAGNSMQFWAFGRGENAVRIPIKPRYSVNSIRLALQAACQGVGICLIPKAILTPLVEKGALELLLPEAECSAGIVYLVWADRKLVSARVTAFRDMIIERLNQPFTALSSLSER